MGAQRHLEARRGGAHRHIPRRHGILERGPASWASGLVAQSRRVCPTGPLALYRPSAVYSNYRLEFFAQIESKSMGWVVRARDLQNYYAMKFTVVESGLRP